MKKLRSHRVGIDQGTVELFSDFVHGGDMWTGSGTRERRQRVVFSEAFSDVPSVHVALALWDFDSSANIRADLYADNVGRDGFEMVFRTWADTRVARVRTSWLAIGEVKGEDDWDVY
ncbi:H-type lectin domain-containing protein [Roseivivax sediminis]|uniref:H-type lectin domain-containing protein n=1 Tax=Roseivivax sediminis TaxID=936889 RepID=A0A1I2BN19_9RHOB|nr:H-type lectin domain-containing protein [Roseivivax sediminis]SFE57575.1 H-type lectin domain-containing protein [Roseivivax sediminis]